MDIADKRLEASDVSPDCIMRISLSDSMFLYRSISLDVEDDE